MTAQEIKSGPESRGAVKVRPMNALDPAALSKRFVVFTPTGAVLDAVLDRARRDIPGIAANQTVHRVVSHNPDNFWAIARRSRYHSSAPHAEGFIAFLMLNQAGLKSLAAQAFNGANPELSQLARQSEKPAGIYVWAVYGRGTCGAGVPLVFDKISTPLYRDVDMYSRTVTEDGRRFVESLGFRLGTRIGGAAVPHLYCYRRDGAHDERPLYDSYRAGLAKDCVSVTVARTLEDIAKVFSVRSAVYIAEQDCPYEEEFDGNDFSGTHLIGYVGDEPAGCLRIRYFADFAKIERLAVRHEFRNTRLAFQIVRAGIALCRAKGYRRLYGHAKKDLVNFWRRFGFRVRENTAEFVFSDHDYVEIVMDTTPLAQAVGIGRSPYLTIRPEGQWHVAGILDRSAGRRRGPPQTTAPSFS